MCIDDVGVSWRNRQRAQSMPSILVPELIEINVKIPLAENWSEHGEAYFRPRTVRSSGAIMTNFYHLLAFGEFQRSEKSAVEAGKEPTLRDKK
jgi:hypothetical protein